MERSFSKIILILLVLVGLGGYYFFYNQLEWGTYHDEKNKVTFEKPTKWGAGSIEGYTRVAEDFRDPAKPSVLIKMDYPESIIPALGLDTGEEVMVGGKTVRRADHEWETKDMTTGEVTGTQTFTFLMWTAPSGKKIIFEITPWQKPAIHEEVERIIRTFNPT